MSTRPKVLIEAKGALSEGRDPSLDELAEDIRQAEPDVQFGEPLSKSTDLLPDLVKIFLGSVAGILIPKIIAKVAEWLRRDARRPVAISLYGPNGDVIKTVTRGD